MSCLFGLIREDFESIKPNYAGVSKINHPKRGRKYALSKEQEKDLTQKLTELAKLGFALAKEEIKLVLQTYANQINLTTVLKDGKLGDD